MDSVDEHSRMRALWKKPEAEWSDEDLLWVLTSRFTAEPIPPCRVCGGPLSFASAGGGDATRYTCRAAGNDLRHWSASEFKHTRPGDASVLELIRRYRATAGESEAAAVTPAGREERG